MNIHPSNRFHLPQVPRLLKRTVLACIAICASAASPAQTPEDYETAVHKFQDFYNHNQPDSVFSLFSDRIKGIMPLEKTGEMLTKLTEEFGPMISGQFASKDEHFNYYKTTFSKGILMLVIALNKDNKLQSFRFTQYQDTSRSNIVVKTATGNIYGTLAYTPAQTKVPVVLIIPGSGPTDRDGNAKSAGLETNTYHQLADSLQRAGIASVRYDKRGVGESAPAMKNEDDLNFSTAIDDATGFINLLKKDARFSRVIVLGHSEGSLIGMVVAKKGNAAAYISIAGIAGRADKTIEKQIAAQSKELAAKATILFDSLAKGYRITNTDPNLVPIFRPSVIPYMISWLRYDPSIEIKKLSIPILIVQGTTDLQVATDQAEELKKACPHARLKMINGMNHILKQANEDRQQNMATYSRPDLPLHPDLMPAIVQFTRGLK
jgi:uncharacterized protein